MVSSLPAPAGHHGRMPTLIAQPWFVDPEADLQLLSRLYGFTRLHCQCLDDFYATCLLQIQTCFQKHHCEGIGYVQLLWHTPAFLTFIPVCTSQPADRLQLRISRANHRTLRAGFSYWMCDECTTLCSSASPVGWPLPACNHRYCIHLQRGQHKQELLHPTNVLIQLSNQHDLDRLSDGWFGAEATS